MKKIILFVLIFVILFLFNIRINAITMGQEGASFSGYGASTEQKKDSDGNIYFCSEFYKQAPPSGQTCTIDTTWDKKSNEALGIGWIIASNQGYIEKELEINALLAGKGYSYYCQKDYCVGNGNVNVWRSGVDYDGNWKNTSYYLSISDSNRNIKAMVDNANTYANENINKIKLSAYINSYGYSDDKYTISVNVSGSQDSNYTVSYDEATCTTTNKTKNSFVANCDNPGEIMITINASSYSYYTSTRYSCGDNYQKLFKYETVTDTPSTTVKAKVNSCEEDLENNTTLDKRINVFKKYGSKWRNILKTNGATCTNYDNPEPATSCLSSTTDVIFNNTDLSNYTEVIDLNTNTVYCLTTVEFTKQVPINFTKESGKVLTTKAGMIIPETFNTVATRATIMTKCYDPSNEIKDVEFDYTNYISEVKLGNFPLVIKEDNESSEKIKLKYNQATGVYEGSKTVDYYFWNIYFKNDLTGRYVNSLDEVKNTDRDKYIYYGTGLITKFTDYNKTTDLYPLTFSYKYKVNNNFKDASAVCYYDTEKGLIEKDDNDKQKLRLEFRLIKTENPFPGKSGTTRTTGSNWCDDTGNCSGDETNEIVKKEIINSNDSYNKTKEGAKYVIKLTPSDMLNIRDYNKKHPYDDYNFTCINNGETCISNYLTKLRDDNIITTLINDKRACIENNDC